jgi:hypothetical protein
VVRRPISPTLGLVDVLYTTPWVAGTLLLHDIPRVAVFVLVPVFIASWWQDWVSARAATSYFSGQLVGFDVLTAGNYVALVDSWRRPVPAGGIVSTALLVHWTLVFVIYIVWNLAIARTSDDATRQAFIRFSLAEAPLVVVGAALAVVQYLALDIPGIVQPLGIIMMAAGHIGLLVFWRIMSRKEDHE